MSRVERITDPIAQHGEGPVWHPSWAGLRWVDMFAGDVLELDARTQRVIRRRVGRLAAALRPRADGGAILAVERGFALADASLEQIRTLPELWADVCVRMNDGGTSPHGHFFCGSMAYDETAGQGSLYRLDPDGRVHKVLDHVSISNGIAWSPDGNIVYYIDSPTQRVDAFDYDPSGALSARRTVFRIPPEEGTPDGMTVDSEGNLWVALWGGGAVHCYSPEGRLREQIAVPATQVTACTFGGPDLDELYITTSRQTVPRGTQPEAGALFRARPGVRGLPPPCYPA